MFPCDSQVGAVPGRGRLVELRKQGSHSPVLRLSLQPRLPFRCYDFHGRCELFIRKVPVAFSSLGDQDNPRIVA